MKIDADVTITLSPAEALALSEFFMKMSDHTERVAHRAHAGAVSLRDRQIAMKLTLTHNVGAAISFMDRLRSQFPFAAALALTRTAQDVAKALALLIAHYGRRYA